MKSIIKSTKVLNEIRNSHKSNIDKFNNECLTLSEELFNKREEIVQLRLTLDDRDGTCIVLKNENKILKSIKAHLNRLN